PPEPEGCSRCRPSMRSRPAPSHARVGRTPTPAPPRALAATRRAFHPTSLTGVSSRTPSGPFEPWRWIPMRAAAFPVALAAACLLAGSASADPIGPDDCSTCQGASFELSYEPVPNGGNTYEITLRIDTSGYAGDGVRIGEVAFKVSSSLTSVSLLDAPG